MNKPEILQQMRVTIFVTNLQTDLFRNTQKLFAHSLKLLLQQIKEVLIGFIRVVVMQQIGVVEQLAQTVRLSKNY